MTDFISLSMVLPDGRIVPIIQSLGSIRRITARPDGCSDVEIKDEATLVVAESFASLQQSLGTVQV